MSAGQMSFYIKCYDTFLFYFDDDAGDKFGNSAKFTIL